jgi:hypothetical protein
MTNRTDTQANPAHTRTAQTWRNHIQACVQRLAAALLRAEAHIMENFRVPPGGG